MRTALERNNDFKVRTDGREGRVERGVERESERVKWKEGVWNIWWTERMGGRVMGKWKNGTGKTE